MTHTHLETEDPRMYISNPTYSPEPWVFTNSLSSWRGECVRTEVGRERWSLWNKVTYFNKNNAVKIGCSRTRWVREEEIGCEQRGTWTLSFSPNWLKWNASGCWCFTWPICSYVCTNSLSSWIAECWACESCDMKVTRKWMLVLHLTNALSSWRAKCWARETSDMTVTWQ